MPLKNLISKFTGNNNETKSQEKAQRVLDTFAAFGIEMDLIESIPSSAALRIRMRPKRPVRMHEIRGFADDLRFALGVEHLRIEAPLPGTKSIEVLIPRDHAALYSWQEAIASEPFKQPQTPTTVVLGRDEFGNTLSVDLHTLPHLLISGVMGSGKSTLLHCIINSLIVRNIPEALQLILIGPNQTEFGGYSALPHMLTRMIDQPRQALLAIRWLTKEMDRRFDIISQEKVRDIGSYHKRIGEIKTSEDQEQKERMPFIVLVIDELTNLMETYPAESEAALSRLTQTGHTVGIHVIISAQRPTSKILPDSITTNMPARLSLKAASKKDSQAVVRTEGAEDLPGVGDIIYQASNFAEPIRGHAAYISVQEIEPNIQKASAGYEDFTSESEQGRRYDPAVFGVRLPGYPDQDEDEPEDELFEEAKEAVIKAGKASTSIIQRKLRIGYGRAARLIDMLEERGVVGPADGARGRDILIAQEE
jgi:S-DNA-T family DNA segregation ATPase FtsK/SpoIIIE